VLLSPLWAVEIGLAWSIGVNMTSDDGGGGSGPPPLEEKSGWF
jgi:hypothetical protein